MEKKKKKGKKTLLPAGVRKIKSISEILSGAKRQLPGFWCWWVHSLHSSFLSLDRWLSSSFLGVFVQERHMSYAADGEFAAKFPCEHSAWMGVLAVSRTLSGKVWDSPLRSRGTIVGQSRNLQVLAQIHCVGWEDDFWLPSEGGIHGICPSASLLVAANTARQMLLRRLHQFPGLCSQECKENNLWNENIVLENMTQPMVKGLCRLELANRSCIWRVCFKINHVFEWYSDWGCFPEFGT